MPRYGLHSTTSNLSGTGSQMPRYGLAPLLPQTPVAQAQRCQGMVCLLYYLKPQWHRLKDAKVWSVCSTTSNHSGTGSQMPRYGLHSTTSNLSGTGSHMQRYGLSPLLPQTPVAQAHRCQGMVCLLYYLKPQWHRLTDAKVWSVCSTTSNPSGTGSQMQRYCLSALLPQTPVAQAHRCQGMVCLLYYLKPQWHRLKDAKVWFVSSTTSNPSGTGSQIPRYGLSPLLPQTSVAQAHRCQGMVCLLYYLQPQWHRLIDAKVWFVSSTTSNLSGTGSQMPRYGLSALLPQTSVAQAHRCQGMVCLCYYLKPQWHRLTDAKVWSVSSTTSNLSGTGSQMPRYGLSPLLPPTLVAQAHRCQGMVWLLYYLKPLWVAQAQRCQGMVCLLYYLKPQWHRLKDAKVWSVSSTTSNPSSRGSQMPRYVCSTTSNPSGTGSQMPRYGLAPPLPQTPVAQAHRCQGMVCLLY